MFCYILLLGLFYKILSETTDIDIDGDYKLISTIKLLSETKKEYDKVMALKPRNILLTDVDNQTKSKPKIRSKISSGISCEK